MDRRTALKSLGATVLGAPAILSDRYRVFPWSGQEYSARAIRLVEESTVVDLLCQFRFPDYRDGDVRKDRLWLDTPSAFTEEDWVRYRESGVNALALGRGASGYEDALRFFARWNGFIASNGHRFARIDSADDFGRVKQAGKVGLMLTFQNSEHFRRPDDVTEFYNLGQRVSQLTYNYQNMLGAGFLEHQDGGLTVFGGRIVERMNEVGMAVDVSHCADRTTLDGIEASTRPVLFSHATCRALLPGHLRCKTDDAIHAMARTGGVMGIAFIRFMISLEEPVTIEHALDHFDHVARLVGVEHVGIGSDMDIEGNASPTRAPDDPPTWDAPNFDRYQMHMNEQGRESIAGLDHPKRVFDLTEGLIRRGYSDADIALVLGGNFERVLSEIWV
jgi:membrane dipeptidase